MILIVIIVLILLFLIFREVSCWYWKINEKINLQRTQNSILEQILKELRENALSASSQKELHIKDGNADDFIELSAEEQQQVDMFVKFGIPPGQRLAINKITRKIDRFDNKEWDELDQSEWIILVEN